jgi:hypothetical protein
MALTPEQQATADEHYGVLTDAERMEIRVNIAVMLMRPRRLILPTYNP